MSRRQAVPGAPEGGLIVDKPAGPTSHDVVAVTRRALRQPRIGHAGTLDPMATGVLVLLLGRATRLAQYLASSDKTYLATVAFGQATSTGDASGTPIGPARDVTLERAGLESLLPAFRGRQRQVPPAVSAKHVGGRRAYDLARRDEPIDLAPVEVEVAELTLVSCGPRTAQLRVTCSAGYYVRSLARDLGVRLGVGAHLAALQRERSGPWTLSGSVGLDWLVNDPAGAAHRVIPMADLLADWPSMALTADEVALVGHGRAVPVSGRAPEGPVTRGRLRLIDPSGRLVGLADHHAGLLHPVLVLM